MATERLSASTDTGETVTPRRAKENFLQRLDTLIPLVRDSMEKSQARYKWAFEKRVQARCEALRVGDWVFFKSHENQGGKLVFKTLGPYQILKKAGRRQTITREDTYAPRTGTTPPGPLNRRRVTLPRRGPWPRGGAPRCPRRLVNR